MKLDKIIVFFAVEGLDLVFSLHDANFRAHAHASCLILQIYVKYVLLAEALVLKVS